MVPSVNQSLFVDAPNYLLSSISIPLANRGYYVFPVNTVKVVLEQEGLYEPEKIQQLEPAKLAAMFGADAVLYVTIVQWTAAYVVLSTRVTVELDYRMVDKSNTDIWKAHKTMAYTPQQTSTGNAFADLIGSLVSPPLLGLHRTTCRSSTRPTPMFSSMSGRRYHSDPTTTRPTSEGPAKYLGRLLLLSISEPDPSPYQRPWMKRGRIDAPERVHRTIGVIKMVTL